MAYKSKGEKSWELQEEKNQCPLPPKFSLLSQLEPGTPSHLLLFGSSFLSPTLCILLHGGVGGAAENHYS